MQGVEYFRRIFLNIRHPSTRPYILPLNPTPRTFWIFKKYILWNILYLHPTSLPQYFTMNFWRNSNNILSNILHPHSKLQHPILAPLDNHLPLAHRWLYVGQRIWYTLQLIKKIMCLNSNKSCIRFLDFILIEWFSKWIVYTWMTTCHLKNSKRILCAL